MNPYDPQATLTFEADIQIWGASLWGYSDPSAIVAENGEHWYRGPLWDIQGHSGWSSGGVPVPLWWSLPYVSDLMMMQDTAT